MKMLLWAVALGGTTGLLVRLVTGYDAGDWRSWALIGIAVATHELGRVRGW